MNLRRLLAFVAAAVLLAGCGGSSAPSAADRAAGSSSAASSAAPTAAVSGGTIAGASPGAAAGGRASPASPGAAGAAAPTATTGSSTTSSSTTSSTTAGSTAPGTYTYDTSGTVTAGTPRDASGTATLTVDAPAGKSQHSALANDQGRTEQDIVSRTTGAYLARLHIANPAFDKEFRPSSPVLLVPNPAAPGRTWSWTATSTDGKTTVAVTARITRRETLTIGGAATPTSLVTSTLKLTGDVTYTAQMQNWYDAAHRLSVKDHTRGSGTFGGVAFTTDITSVLRSTRPA